MLASGSIPGIGIFLLFGVNNLSELQVKRCLHGIVSDTMGSDWTQ